MTHAAFFIVLGIVLLFIIGFIIAWITDEYEWMTASATAALFIGFLGLFVFPSIIPSTDRITKTPLIKNEYVVEKVDIGLMITYNKYYTIVSDYKVVSTFNDSTEVILKEQTSYYKTPGSMERFIEIQGETYPLIEIYK